MSKTKYIFLTLIIALSTVFAQQKMTIKGHVTDVSKNSLLGANIYIPSAQVGITSDVDGNYKFEVPISLLKGKETNIKVSYVGYKTIIKSFVPVAGTLELNFVLEEDVFKSDEIIVTGIASKTSKAVAEVAVSRINAAELTAKQPYTSLSQLVAGKVSGVQVSTTSGNVGGGYRFFVRGGGGLNGNEQPVIYVDGIRIDNSAIEGFTTGGQDISIMANLNPEDIANMEFLKGPASAAEYGTSGSNGVVLITTKSGQGFKGVGSSYKVDYKYEYGSNVQSYEYTKDDYISYEDANDIFVTGLVKHHSVGISGGIPTLRYYAGIDKKSEGGIIRNNNMDRTSLRLNLDVLPSNKLTFNFRSSYVDNNISRPVNDNSIFGFLGNTLLKPESYTYLDSLAIIKQQNEIKVHQFIGSAGLTYTPIKNLEVSGRIGLDYSDLRNDALRPFGFNYRGRTRGSKQIYNRRNTQYSGDFSAKYKYNIMDKLEAKSTLGAQIFEKRTTTNWMNVKNFSTGLITNVGGADEVEGKNDSKTHLRSAGLFATQYFAYDNAYFLTLSLRNDYASAIGADAPNIIYPKASFAVRLDKLMDISSVFNLLKFRFSYGENGQLPSLYDVLSLLWRASKGGYGGGATISNIGNPKLEPERIGEFEIGVDFEIFKNYSFELTYYNSTASNSIIGFRNSPSTGKTASAVPFNVGGIENYGFEVLIQASPIRNEIFGLDMNLILNYQSNEVTDLGGAQPIYDGYNNNVIKEGLAKHEFHFPKIIGPKFNKDGYYIGLLYGTEKVSFGNPYPDFTGSFSVNFNLFEDLNIYVLTDWATGFKVKNDTKIFATKTGNNPQYNEIVSAMKKYEKDGDVKAPQYIALANQRAKIDPYGASNYVEDADFFKIREVSLSYNFTNLISSFTQAKHVKDFIIGLSARNIFTTTKYSGPDVEVNSEGSRSGTRGLDFLTLQNPRSYFFWIKLGL